MTVGSGEAFRYVVVHPGDHGFEARNPGAIFVALSGAKSAGGEGRDPDFAFHEDVLIKIQISFRDFSLIPRLQEEQKIFL